MIPHDIPGLCGSWRFEQDRFKTDCWRDPLDGVVYDGFEDMSGYGNHFTHRLGTLVWQERDGREGLLLDNLQVLVAVNPIPYEGTMVAVFEDAMDTGTTRRIVRFENYAQASLTAGAPGYALHRTVGSGNNRMTWGIAGDVVTFDGAGDSTTGGTRQVLATSANQTLAQVSGRMAADASDTDNATTTTGGTSPKGAQIAIGRLKDEIDASRTILADIARLWIRELHFWDFDVLKDATYATELHALMDELAL